MKRYFYSILTLVILLGCNDEEFDPTETETVILEGFLYENAPVNNIRISQLIPFIGEESDSYEISDAMVTISSGGNDYLLEASEEPGFYSFSGNELVIRQGDEYAIQFDYFGESISAATTVPSRPTGLELSVDHLEIAQINSFEDLFNRVDGDPLEVYWDNPNGNYYYVLIENLEENPEEINQLEFDGQRPNFQLVTEPTSLDVYNVRPPSLTQYGEYRVVLYHVNQEYVDLYETAEQDSRNLTEPLNNINNGLGIFTSFSSDTAYFEITKP